MPAQTLEHVQKNEAKLAQARAAVADGGDPAAKRKLVKRHKRAQRRRRKLLRAEALRQSKLKGKGKAETTEG